jgi:hypothetical protein
MGVRFSVASFHAYPHEVQTQQNTTRPRSRFTSPRRVHTGLVPQAGQGVRIELDRSYFGCVAVDMRTYL